MKQFMLVLLCLSTLGWTWYETGYNLYPEDSKSSNEEKNELTSSPSNEIVKEDRTKENRKVASLVSTEISTFFSTKISTRQTDSVVLRKFYDLMGGTNWESASNWLSKNSPINTWEGVKVDPLSGRVVGLDMSRQGAGNNLDGTVPRDIIKLSELEELNLSYNHEVKGFVSLDSLFQLKKLELVGNNLIQALPSMEDLTNLEYLNISRIVSLRGFGGSGLRTSPDLSVLSALETLYLDNHPLLKGNVIGLNSLTNLRSVSLIGCGFTTFPNLTSLGQITHLRLGKDLIKLSSLDSLSRMDSLTQLTLRRLPHMKSLPDLSNNTNLVSLDISENIKLEILPDLSTLPRLKDLYISGSPSITNLEVINKLSILEILVAQECLLDTLPPIDSLTDLIYLDLSNNRLRSLPDMSGLVNLNYLSLKNNFLSSLNNLPATAPYLYFDIRLNQLPYDQARPYLGLLNSSEPNLFAKYLPQKFLDVQIVQNVSPLDSPFIITQPDKDPISKYKWYKVSNGGDLLIGNDPQFEFTVLDTNVNGSYYSKVTNPDFDFLNQGPNELVRDTITLNFEENPDPYDPKEHIRDFSLLIQFKEELDLDVKQGVEEQIAADGLKKIKECDCKNIQLWKVPDTLVDVQDNGVIKLIIGSEEVIAHTEDDPLRPKEDPNNPAGKPEWDYPVNLGTPPTDGKRFRTSPLTVPDSGRKIKVAVIDFGIDSTHQVINPVINPFSNPTCYDDDNLGFNFWDNSNDPFQDDYPEGSGHGTHIAGLIADLLPADCIDIMSLQIGDAQGQTGVYELACALQQAIDKEVDIINLSVGYYGPRIKAIDSLIEQANKKKIFIIASAGNDSLSNDRLPTGHWPSNYNLPNVIAVGAYNQFIRKNADTTYYQKAKFSNFGRETVDFFGPGVGIYAPVPGPPPGNSYGYKSGTSIASAFATALFAKHLSGLPERMKLDLVEVSNSFFNDETYTVHDDTLEKYCGSGQRTNIELIDCEREPIAEEDFYSVPVGRTVVLDVLNNDCYGPNTNIELMGNFPVGFSIGVDSERKPIIMLNTVGKNLGTFDTLSYQLLGQNTTNLAQNSAMVVVRYGELVQISGSALMANGSTMSGVDFIAEDKSNGSQIKIENATTYTFDLPRGSSFSIRAEKLETEKNGVDGGDIVSLKNSLKKNKLSNSSESLKGTYLLAAADVNMDSRIDDNDIDKIAAYIVDDKEGFGIGNNANKTYVFIPSDSLIKDPIKPITYSQVKNYSTLDFSSFQEDYLGVRLGDYNPVFSASAVRRGIAEVLNLRLPNRTTYRRDTLRIPIYTSSSFEGLTSFQFTADWNPDALKFQGIEQNGLPIKIGKKNQNGGHLSVLWYNENGEGENFGNRRKLFTLKLLVVGRPQRKNAFDLNGTITPIIAYNDDATPSSVRIEVDSAEVIIWRGPCAWFLRICRSIGLCKVKDD